jgi:pyruvate formate lyase activating enzyme
MTASGLVFDIQRFSVHDGPGIRTTVFLKGCSLRCFWCHNPEGLRMMPEVQFLPDRCLGCGACVTACEHDGQHLDDGMRSFERERCVACGACVEACVAEALTLVGKRMAAEDVVAEVMRDRVFYETSGGGVTLSGGEPALQPDFSREVLAQCKAQGLHTAIETCGNVPWTSLEGLLPVTDLVMMDLKHVDSEKHRAATGAGNERILANARQLALTRRPLVFRTPVVPGVNDTPAEIAAIAAFVRELVSLRGISSNGSGPAELSWELLPFHRLAADKYRSLGLDYRARVLNPPPKDQMAVLAESAQSSGVVVRAY